MKPGVWEALYLTKAFTCTLFSLHWDLEYFFDTWIVSETKGHSKHGSVFKPWSPPLCFGLL